MKHTTPEEERKKRLNVLIGKISNAEVTNKMAGTYSSLTLLLGWGQIKWGCKRETVREYLRALEDAGLISTDEKTDVVHWVGTE